MKFDYRQTINDIELSALRSFLKRFIPHVSQSEGVRIQKIYLLERRRLLNNPNTCGPLIKQAKSEKMSTADFLDRHVPGVVDPFIQASELGGFISVAHGFAKLTDLGGSFVLSRKKRYARVSARRQLDVLIERCKLLNQTNASMSDPVSLAKVAKLEVFGSFLEGDDAVGDVDVYIEIVFKDKSILQANESMVFSLKYNPIVLALSKLKKGLNIISVTTSKAGLNTRFETIAL